MSDNQSNNNPTNNTMQSSATPPTGGSGTATATVGGSSIKQQAPLPKQGLSKGQLLLLISFLLGIFIGAMDSGIVSPARTVIEDNLNITPDKSIWIITLYILFYAISMPIVGKLADIFGKKKVYIICITIFMIGSFFSGISDKFHSFPMLLVCRAIHDLGCSEGPHGPPAC